MMQRVKIKHAMALLLVLTGFLACKRSTCVEAPDVSDIDIEVNIERLDRTMMDLASTGEVAEFLRDNPVVAEVYYQRSGYPGMRVLADSLYNMLQNESLRKLFADVAAQYADVSDIEADFQMAFRIIRHHYPEFDPPKIQAIATGFFYDNYISDSLIIIGLDYYLGEESDFAPPYPKYMLKRYQRPYIVPQFMLQMATGFVRTSPRDQTALADMIFYGKSYYFARHMVPCAPDSLFTGYTAEETDEIEEHEQVIWASFLENELLYETSHFTKNKFFSERPKTLEVGEKCPGRIGRWIGWRIIRSFMEQNPDVDLRTLMGMTDARAIFNRSKYKPIPY